jgi:uncharacterized protein
MGGYGSGAPYWLGLAVDRNDLELAEWLLAHGASPNAAPSPHSNLTKRTLHEEAQRRGFTEMGDLLLRYGATPGVAVLEGQEAFAAACFRLDREAAEALLEAHPEYLLAPGPMSLAARLDRADVVAFLLDLGMSPDIEDPRAGRQRPLHVAAYHDAARAAALLIERGAEIDCQDSSHHATPLWFAVWDHRPRTIELLSRFSRDVRSLAVTGHVERLREVLSSEPELAKVVRNSETPLMWLPGDEAHAIEIVELLLAHGADPTHKNNQGLTAAECANKRGLEEVARLLSAAE